MSARETAKLLGGSMLVYAIASGQALAADGEHAAGARLAPMYLEADDGSRQFLGWHDTAHDVDCSFASAADGAWRCLPSGADAGRFFADAACTQRLATIPRGCASPPAFAIVRDVPACVWQQSRQVFSLGERYTGPLAYWMAAGACAAVSSNDVVLYDFYVVGDEVAPSSFVAATPAIER
jgi:hypothetical protein